MFLKDKIASEPIIIWLSLQKPSSVVSSTEKKRNSHTPFFIVFCPSLKRSLATSGVSITQNSPLIDMKGHLPFQTYESQPTLFGHCNIIA